MQDALNENVTREGFFISKAEVEISDNSLSEKFLCSIKHNKIGEYIISVRSRTGIEGARIFIYNDTILVNDRINRKLYYGSEKDLFRKFSVTAEILPLILGDYIVSDFNKDTKLECSDGEVIDWQDIKGMKVEYTIDCRRLKVIAASFGVDNSVKLQFSHFNKSDDKFFPAEIKIFDTERNKNVVIKIKNIEYPWDGEIDFVPGTRYEQKPLL